MELIEVEAIQWRSNNFQQLHEFIHESNRESEMLERASNDKRMAKYKGLHKKYYRTIIAHANKSCSALELRIVNDKRLVRTYALGRHNMVIKGYYGKFFVCNLDKFQLRFKMKKDFRYIGNRALDMMNGIPTL